MPKHRGLAILAEGSRGHATLPLPNYLNALVNLDVFGYSEYKSRIPYRGKL